MRIPVIVCFASFGEGRSEGVVGGKKSFLTSKTVSPFSADSSFFYVPTARSDAGGAPEKLHTVYARSQLKSFMLPD